MSNPLTDARKALVPLLEPLGYRVYPNPVEVPAPPCIQIFTQGDWVTNPRLRKGSRDVRLLLRLSVPTKGGAEQALEVLEQMVWDVMNTVIVQGDIQALKLDISSQTESYVVDLPVATSI